MFEQLFNNTFLYSLSLTLMHFLWQGLLVGLILKSALSIIDNNKSKLRYGLASLAMLANLVIAVLTFIIIYSDAGTSIANNLSPIPLNNIVNVLTQESNSFTYKELLHSILAYSMPYLSIFWLATIITLAGKLLIEVRNVNHLPMQATVSPTDELLSRFAELAKQIKLPKTPKLLISLKVDVPMAIGWLKPVVLLPASMVTGLDSAQLEMLLLHELAHIRRHDYLVNFLQTLIELLFFFHPCIHWIGKQMRNEREYCSDDVAVQHCGDAIAYAHTLTDTASLCAKKHCHTIPTMAMAASGGDLKARVVRLVDHHCAPSNDTARWLAALSLLLAIALVGINQLLTTPLGYSLNRQLPWYDANAITNKSEPPTVNNEYINYQNTAPLVANNSLALQLLNSDEDKPSYSLSDNINSLNQPGANNLQAPFDTTAVVMKASVDAIDNNSPTIKNPNLSTSNLTNIQQGAVKPTSDIANKSVQKQVVKSSSQTLVQVPSTIKASISPVKLPTKEVIATTATIMETPKTNRGNIAKTNEFTNLSLPVKNIAKVSTQIATGLNQSPTTRVNKSQQQSYSQAIDEFELLNDRYTASHALRIKDNANFTNNMQFPIKEEPKTIKSINAKLLNPTSPIYPSLAKLRGLEMQVKVNFTVDRDGKVKNIDFGKQHNVTYFKSAIRSAIRKWRFTPATVNNDIVESKMSKIFSFSLES